MPSAHTFRACCHRLKERFLLWIPKLVSPSQLHNIPSSTYLTPALPRSSICTLHFTQISKVGWIQDTIWHAFCFPLVPTHNFTDPPLTPTGHPAEICGWLVWDLVQHCAPGERSPTSHQVHVWFPGWAGRQTQYPRHGCAAHLEKQLVTPGELSGSATWGGWAFWVLGASRD